MSESGRLIETVSDIECGAQYLVGLEPRFSEALALTGPLPLRKREEGFTALLDMIVSQQVSVAAADSIWRRLKCAGFTEQEALRNCSEEDIRACGLSRQKTRYAKALAEQDLNYDELRHLPDAELVARLVRILGIGRWTAELYGMFALGRPDMFAAGDLALQESARILFCLDCRPTEQALRELAEPWSPWRAVAARLLWAYYRAVKMREGVR